MWIKPRITAKLDCLQEYNTLYLPMRKCHHAAIKAACSIEIRIFGFVVIAAIDFFALKLRLLGSTIKLRQKMFPNLPAACPKNVMS